MAIELPDATRRQLISSLRRYFERELDEEIGDLKARMLLDYLLIEVAPVAYNQGVRDAQSYIQDKTLELDGSVYEPEMTWWDRDGRRR